MKVNKYLIFILSNAATKSRKHQITLKLKERFSEF